MQITRQSVHTAHVQLIPLSNELNHPLEFNTLYIFS